MSERLILKSPAKINLFLKITGKRSDGYHDIETVVYPVKWNDVLEIIPAEKKGRNDVQFKTTGIKIKIGVIQRLKNKAIKRSKTTSAATTVKLMSVLIC